MRSKYEKVAQKSLEAQGYKVDYKIRPRMVPRGYKVDFFGLFDLVAHRAGEPLRWISIKGREGIPGPHRRGVEQFFMSEGNQKELWRYKDKNHVKRELIP